MAGWRDIATAPKDGVAGVSIFDLWVTDRPKGRRVTNCFYDSKDDRFIHRVEFIDTKSRRNIRFAVAVSPTHWRKIPKPPGQGA